MCPDPERMPQHFDLEGRLRRCMLTARVGVIGDVHDCRAWYCRHRAETADAAPKPCPQHGVSSLHTTPRVRQLKFHDLRRSHASLLAAAG